jgi:tetratricopeptide (TPR) repeat protein
LKKEKKHWILAIDLILLALVIVGAYSIFLHFERNLILTGNIPQGYVGREACISCHNIEYSKWQGSHHDRSMDIATDATVMGDFNNVEVESGGKVHKLYKKENKFYAWTVGEEGSMQEFEIKYVFGFCPLQNYMVEFDKGRVQVLALTWNSMDSAWYHMADSVYKNEKYDHENWLHWSNQAQNWNSMCADCHSTNLQKGYNYETGEYETTWSEIDVSCETCHGPAMRHVTWAEIDSLERPKIENFGLGVKTSGIDNKQYVDFCQRCHSRRMAFGDFPYDHTDVYQHTDFSLPRPPEYFIDGQILDEDYVYGSFTQTKMYMLNVSCKNCHDVHSGELLFEGNALCRQCHEAVKYESYSHHFHQEPGGRGEAVISESGIRFEVGEGSKCINCHMHGRYYMGVDYRRDHSFRVTRPDMTKSMGVPNACNQCHAKESVKWAQSYFDKWYGTDHATHYGEVFYQAQQGDVLAVDPLIGILNDPLYSPVIKRTAMEFLASLPVNNDSVFVNRLHSKDPGIRLSALRSIQLNSIDLVNQVLPCLSDPVKALRLEAANRLAGINFKQLADSVQLPYKAALSEYLEVLKYNSDFPIGKFSLGNFYYNTGDYQHAEKYYLAALNQDSELQHIKVNLAYLYYNNNQLDNAAKYFKDYLKQVENDGEVMYAYALLLSEMKEYESSLEYLQKAAKLNPEIARIDYNLAMMYDYFEKKELAVKYIKSAIGKDSGNLEYYSALLDLYSRYKQAEMARRTAKEIVDKFPKNKITPELLKRVEENMVRE